MRVLIKGMAEFISYHLAKLLLGDVMHVHGSNALTGYIDMQLKPQRCSSRNFLGTSRFKLTSATRSSPPRACYLVSNIVGTFTVMEARLGLGANHFLMMSTT